MYEKLVSAIYNDVVSGLGAYHQTMAMSLEQLEDDVVDERLIIIKEYALKGIIPKKDLMLSLNCIPVDCESLERCKCKIDEDLCEELVAHFEIPQIALDFGIDAIDYIGTTDRSSQFKVFTSTSLMKYNKHRKRAKKKPYIYIDYTPNEHNMNDGFIFNAPLIKQISAVFIPKDPRQLEEYGCCPTEEINNFSFINNEIKRRLTQKKLMYYRQYRAQLLPNDQSPQP